MGFDTEYQLWLRQEMDRRDWNISDLARASHRSHTSISSQISGLVPPNYKVCRAIAEAFGIPPSTVFTKAGLDQEAEGENELETELIWKIKHLNPEQQEIVLDIVSGLIKRSRKTSKRTPEP